MYLDRAAVLAHALEWEEVFAPAMAVILPDTERRQVDMAKGVIVSASTVFIGHAPNCEYSYLLDLPRCVSRPLTVSLRKQTAPAAPTGCPPLPRER